MPRVSFRSVPICLSVAGLDPSGGAGILADVKTFSALGCYGASVATALTVQNTMGVQAVHPVASDVLEAQLEAVFSDFEVVHVKIGMVATPENVQVVLRVLERHASHVPSVVYDPVMASTDGTCLMVPSSLSLLREELFPRCTLVTPNIPEACRLWGCREEIRTPFDVIRWLVPRCRPVAGESYLLKGGHLSVGRDAVVTDLLVTPEGVHPYSGPLVETRNTHGTGCTLSSAVTAFLASGHVLPDAVRRAKQYLTAALKAGRGCRWGHGHGSVNHFFHPLPLCENDGREDVLTV